MAVELMGEQSFYDPEVLNREAQNLESVATAGMVQIGGRFENTFHHRAFTKSRYLGTFIVKRFVEEEGHEIFAESRQILGHYEESGMVPDEIGLSLISKRDASRIRSLHSEVSDEELLRRYEESLSNSQEIQERRFCTPSRIQILGSHDDRQDTIKCVALTFEPKSERRLRKERLSMLSDFGIRQAILNETPHLTLFRTNNMRAARQAARALKAVVPPKSAISPAQPVKLLKPEPRRLTYF